MSIGKEMHDFASSLWGFNRSITGDGVRKTLKKIQEHLPSLNIYSVSSGTQAFDWTIPKEWSCNQAFIICPDGKKICNFQDNNLHLVGYSQPFRGIIPLEVLNRHLFSLPEQPNAIPYVTSYYEKSWGFCIADNERLNLVEGDYEVVIDSKIFNGELNYGELIIKGSKDSEVLLSTYICHPSMANNELSGIVVSTFLAKWLSSLHKASYTYRIIFIPETIGSIYYLSKHHQDLKKKVIAGFNISCVGDDRAYSYLPSRSENSLSDQIAKHVLKWTEKNYKNYKWLDRGSDERQYCSPGIDLPIASIMRTKYGEYPEYHTSLDDLYDVVTPKGLKGGYTALKRALEIIEKNEKFLVNVLCEPQMGKRGLYANLSMKNSADDTRVIMDTLTYCDGSNSLLDIAEKINMPCWELYKVIEILKEHNLIRAITKQES